MVKPGCILKNRVSLWRKRYNISIFTCMIKFFGGQDFKDSNFNLSYFVPPVLVNLGASEFARPPGN